MSLDYIRLDRAAEVPSWLQVFASFSCGDFGARGMHFRTFDAAVGWFMDMPLVRDTESRPTVTGKLDPSCSATYLERQPRVKNVLNDALPHGPKKDCAALGG